MGNLAQQAAELEVEQPAGGRPEDMWPPTEVDGDSTTETEGDNVAGMWEECRPSGTWVECT
jgi:hypothetical protein